jgi:polar amino acid transport system substrate-binding protein
MLARIKANGVIRVATDPNYAPQSFLRPDGTFEGFDIDVANEIAKRLGVTVEFVTPDWAAIESGHWADRFDISVGSMTITETRKEVLDFTQPYYFTPAQMAATTASGITTLDGLAGQTVCAGEGTTYVQWMEGTLALGDGSALAPVPAGIIPTTFTTDLDCAQAIQSGRNDFQGWLSSSTTVAGAIADGAPFVLVGDPVFYEPLAVAIDKESPTHTGLLAAIDGIIAEMHADGTLTGFSERWFGQDLTAKQ